VRNVAGIERTASIFPPFTSSAKTSRVNAAKVFMVMISQQDLPYDTMGERPYRQVVLDVQQDVAALRCSLYFTLKLLYMLKHTSESLK
jgi:hypothetical protein